MSTITITITQTEAPSRSKMAGPCWIAIGDVYASTRPREITAERGGKITVTGKAILRDYINATVGFKELSEIVHRSPKSLMRMLGPSGNPHAQNLFDIIAYLQQEGGVHLKIRAAHPGQGGHRSLRRRA